MWTFFASNDMQGGILTDANGDRYASNVVGGSIMVHHALSHAGEYGNGNYKVDFIIQRRDSVQTMEKDLIANLQVYSRNRILAKEEIDVTASMIPVGSGWVNIIMEVTLATHELDDIGFKLKMYPGLHEIGYRRVHIKYLCYDTVAPTQVPSQMQSLYSRRGWIN